MAKNNGIINLNVIVEQARNDSFFVGRVLAEFEKAKNVNSRNLAEWLECDREGLNRLALCVMPSETANDFKNSIRKIAEYAPCNPDKLIQMIREIASVQVLKNKVSGDAVSGMLMAARDRKNEKDNKKRKNKQ